MVPREKPRSYYGRPVVKPPVWTWEIPLYFFTGGTGGASAALAYAAERAGNRRLARSAWKVAFAGISASPPLLVSDLGKPRRFFNMMRVFKPTSPMSVGSWILLANGAAIVPAAAYGVLGRFGAIGRPAQAASAAVGLPLATYTAVLVANSAVPVWSEARWELPLSFAGSAAASAGAAATVLTPPEHAAPARRLAIGGALIETAATEVMHRRLGDLGSPYGEGTAGRFAKAAKGLTVGGAALLGASTNRSRAGAVAGAAMLISGSLCERWAVFRAGVQSAGDPSATIGPQRERLGRD
ncbi:MAG: polysulfide reductase [Solirubrobacterales bacterium]|nr:polysulfide reductase [Solirubrobacterales bacterium]